MGAKDKLREFFLKNVGKVVTSRELKAAAGDVTEWARRVRELRNQEGFEILTHNDRDNLKPGQYLLVSPTPKGGASRALSQRVRAEILERDGHTCQMCGVGAGEPDPVDPSKKARLQVDHVDTTLQEPALNAPSNLITKCRACNEGRKNFVPPPRRAIDIMNMLRPAPEAVKKEIYDWLRGRLDEDAD